MSRTTRTRWALTLAGVACLALAAVTARTGSPGGDADAGPGAPESVVVVPSASSPAASLAVERLHLLRTGNGPGSLSLSGEELSVVLTEALPGLLPAGIHDPRVTIDGGRVRVRVSIVTDEWLPAEGIVGVLRVLPDTLDAEVRGRLVRVGRRATYRIEEAFAHGVPLPDPVIRGLVNELPGGGLAGGERASGPVDATLRLMLPEGIADFEVVGDRLVVRAAEPILDRTVDGDGEP